MSRNAKAMPPIAPVPPVRSRVPAEQAEAFERAGERIAKAIAGTPPPTSGVRRGTAKRPHVRQDGVKTRAVGWHIPVDVAHQVRVAAAQRGVSQSEFVTDILAEWFSNHPDSAS